MKKRLLAMLLVLMLVVSLLPVGALAAGQIYQGNETFSYHITDSSLQAMVDKYNTSGSTSDVESVSITFDAPYLSGKSTFQFRNGYTIDFSNTSDAVQPDDISHLTIKLESSDSLTVPGDALDWTWVSSLPRRYDLSLDAGDGNCTVTFYVQNGDSFDNSSWIVYQTRTVPVGSTLGDNMPALPTQKDPDAHWIAWEIGGNNGDGRELHADTVITGDMSVYARKTLPSSGGEQIRVMGPENDFIEILKEKLNVETIEINGISAFGGGEETNPYYDPSRVTEEDPTENGWKNDGAYYRVMNTDQVPVPDDVPEHNDRVAPGELEGIKIYATVDGVNDTVITLNRSDLDVRVDQTVLRIYLREATEPDTPVEPDPAPETNPDVSDVRVVVDCETNDEHDKNVAIIGGSYTFNKAWDGDQWTCTVVIDPDDYVDTYNEIVPGHALNPENQTGTLLYIYDGSEWVYNGDVTPTVTFTVACSGTDPEPEEPRDPTEDELNQLYVDLECINADAQHAEKRFHLDQDNSYVTVDFTTGICTVEPRYDFILQRYNEKVSDGHTYADDAERTLLLSWNPETKAWDVAGAPSITRQVKCETPEQPDVYKIYVTVHNGTATFRGSEVTSYILAAENENITITFTPDEGYTLDYATIDGNMLLIPDGGVYTLKWVDSNHTIEVFYESDKIGTEDPNEGDGVPDKYQATVNFVAGENGKVTGNVTKVYTIFGADGKYAEEGVITPSLNGVTVTPDEGYKVDGWTNAAGERVNPESEITVEGGDVVVFTVNFQSDPSLKEITSFEKKLVTDRKTYHSFGLRVPTFIRNGSTVVVDEGKGVTLLYAISLTGTPGAEYAITDTGADVADGYALTGVIPETGVVTVYVTKDFTWREAAAAAYKDDALVNTAAVELTDNPNEPGQESTEEVDVVIDWDDPNVPVVPSDPDDEDEDDEVFVPNWLNTEDHYSYIVGYEDGEVKPNNNITRAEVATIFFRLLTDDARARYWSQTNDYSDIAPESWYNNAVSTLSNMGIINGYEDGTFKPNAPITRAEFTAIATRFFDYTAEYEGAFNDVSRSAWYADCVQAAVDMGLVDGYPDGGFHPNSNITRAEAVTIVNRVLNRAPHEDHLLDEDEMNVWPDNVYGAWYYADMQEATNSHDYDWIRVSGERVEEWTEKLPERDWAALEQEWSSAYSG